MLGFFLGICLLLDEVIDIFDLFFCFVLFDFIEIGIGGFFGGFFGGCFLFNVFVFVDVDNFVKLFFELDLEDWFFVINFIDFINLVSLF